MLIFSGVVAFTTIWYTRLTWKILKETNRPEVSVTLDFQTVSYESRSSGGFRDVSYLTYLRVKNIGTGVARHVMFDGDFRLYPCIVTKHWRILISL